MLVSGTEKKNTLDWHISNHPAKYGIPELEVESHKRQTAQHTYLWSRPGTSESECWPAPIFCPEELQLRGSGYVQCKNIRWLPTNTNPESVCSLFISTKWQRALTWTALQAMPRNMMHNKYEPQTCLPSASYASRCLSVMCQTTSTSFKTLLLNFEKSFFFLHHVLWWSNNTVSEVLTGYFQLKIQPYCYKQKSF